MILYFGVTYTMNVFIIKLRYDFLYNTALKSGRLIGGLASRDIE